MFKKVLGALARDLKERGDLDLSECFIDGSFVIAKKGVKGGKDKAGQEYEDHGSGRQRWSSYLSTRWKCFAT